MKLETFRQASQIINSIDKTDSALRYWKEFPAPIPANSPSSWMLNEERFDKVRAFVIEQLTAEVAARRAELEAM